MNTRFRPRAAFWLAYTDRRSSLALMTSEFRRFVGRRCTNGCLVLHVRRDEFAELVARWKEDFPDLQILRYAKIQKINNSESVGSSFYDTAWENRFTWCIHLRATGEPKYSRGFLWMDITNSEFRAAIVQHLADEVRASGCDGLAIDSHHWDLMLSNTIDHGPMLNANWQASAMLILEQLQNELGPSYTILYNGIWSTWGSEQAREQAAMLTVAGGAAVEFFGVDGTRRGIAAKPDWDIFVGSLLTEMARSTAGKYLVVNGQRPSGSYTTYQHDFAVALYCYANFLLGPLEPRHGFHYGNFQCTKTPKERSGGYDYFDFQDLQLGAPTSSAITTISGADNGYYTPTTATELTAILGTMNAPNPDYLYGFQEDEGNINDLIGTGESKHALIATQLRYWRLAGNFSRRGVRFNGAGVRRATLPPGTGYNPATTSAVWLGLFHIPPLRGPLPTNPLAPRSLISAGNGVNVCVLLNRQIRLTAGTATADTVNSYQDTAQLIGLDYDLDNAVVRLVTELETISVAFAPASDDHKGFGKVTPVSAFASPLVWAALWQETNATNLDLPAIIAALRVPRVGYSRTFERGIVLVAPRGRGAQNFTLHRRYYTTQGVSVEAGSRSLPEGTAEILLTHPPPIPPVNLRVYGSVAQSLWRWLRRTRWKTEWLVQPTKSGTYRYTTIQLQVRSTDAASAILVRVEIDNEPLTHGIVVIRPQPGTFTKTNNDYPYTELPNARATNVYAPETYTTNNTWDTLSVNLDAALGMTCHRVVSMRVVGNVQVSRIALTGRVLV